MAFNRHSTFSSHREMLIEHLLVGDILRHLWRCRIADVEVLKPQVDDSGYDLAIECKSILRHIQLKSSHADAKRANVDVQLKLCTKPSGCVLWIFFDRDTLKLGPFLWFGRGPGEPLPDIRDFRVARHTKADTKGHKAQRPNLRVIPKGRFETLSSISQVVHRLFGIPPP